MLAMKPGNEVVDQFRGRRVVAHHDEAGRHLDAGFAPLVEDLDVVAVEGFEGGLQLEGNAQRVEHCGLAAALSGHPRADVLPQVAELGHVAAGDVVGHRHAGQLDDAALDGVHEREVAHRPGKQRALRCSRSHGGRNGVADRSSTRLKPSLRCTASSPEIHTRAASLFFSASLRSSPLSLPSSLSSSGFSR